jgi:hypothetical protein
MMAAFPGQPGHASAKLMPAASGQGLAWLLPELDQETLDTHQALCKALLTELGANGLQMVCTRYPKLQMVANSTTETQIVLGGDVPRMVLYSLLASFAPTLNVTQTALSLCACLQSCGVDVPEDVLGRLSADLLDRQSDAHPDATPFQTTLLPYELMLGRQSRGVIWGHCAYANGRPVLLIDFPITALVLFRLRTQEARQLQIGAFHQGLTLMSGNENVALAIANHWRTEREAHPSDSLLRFLGAAVEHEVTASNPNPSVAPDNLNNSQLAQLQAQLQGVVELFHRSQQELPERVAAEIARHNTIVEMTRQRVSASTLRDQERLLRLGRVIPSTVDFQTTQPQLSTSSFLEDMLEAENHGVIAHINPVFSQVVKRRKLQECEETHEQCWLHRQQALWRIYYTERDRELMEDVWQTPSVQESLAKMLPLYGHSPTRQTNGSGQSRAGPYGQQSIRAFFRVPP